MNIFQDQWAIILGGSSGIGLASAKKLATHGMNLIIIHRDRRSTLAAVEEAFENIRSKNVQLHAFNEDALNDEKRKTIVQEITNSIGKGNVKLVLHSIAKGNLKEIANESHPLQELDITLTTQAMASSLLPWTNEIRNAGLFSDKARVLALTSEGNDKVWAGYAAVAAAKSSLETLAKYMAVELAPEGLTTNIIQAGVVDTISMNMIPNSAKIKEETVKRNPKGRLTEVEDVANVVYLLCQNEADWINGACIVVDGGESLV